MKKYYINVQEPYFSFIKSGQKTVEGRLNKGKFKDMEIGDSLVINDQIECEVIGKNLYQSFREMIETEGIQRVVPDCETVDDAEQVYYTFYTQDQELEFGVAAIQIRV